jgi:hypothetical protein
VLKRAEETLEIIRPSIHRGERFLARSRNLLGLLAVARALGKFSYQIDELIALEKSKLTADMLLETWKFVLEVRRQSGQKHADDVPASDPTCAAVAKKFGLDGVEQVNRRKFPALRKTHRKLDIGGEAFIELVNGKLPPQPWKPGIHIQVAKQLNVKASDVSAAIATLIARGKWLEQRDGIVYDKEGRVVATDEGRGEQPPR